ncbi:WD repeat-containing protein 53 [Terramyces sp. JEL0728]|nr:WD repeat-containing protein 53 [Terramyces sp. JEL0728]
MFSGHTGSINHLNCKDSQLISCGNDCAIVWDINTQKIIRKFDHVMNQVETEGDTIYFTVDNGLLLLDARTGQIQPIYQATEDINEFAVHFNKKFIGFVDDNGRISVLDTRNYKPFKNFKSGHSNIASCFKFRPTTPWQCVTGGFDCFVKSWDFSRASLQTEYCATVVASDTFNPPFIYSLAFDEAGNTLAAGLGDGKICIFSDFGRGKPKLPGKFQILEKHSWSISGLLYDKNILYSIGIDKQLIKWDAEPVVSKFDFKLNAIAMSNDKIFVAGTADSKSQFNIHVLDK